MLFRLAAFLLALSVADPAAAQSLRLRSEFSGRAAWALPGSLDAALGFASRRSTGASARLIWEGGSGLARFEAQALIAHDNGGDVAYAAALSPFLPTPAPSTLFNLSRSWTSTATTRLSGRIDRLSLALSSDATVLKLGRQAITWGNGLVFHPSDIVAPFAPGALDTTYKPGVDMVYGQLLLDSGADIQAIWVPRPAVAGGPVAFGASTLALRAQATLGPLDGALMLARDRGDGVAGLSLGGALGGASWNAEAVGWQLSSGSYRPVLLLNIANFGQIFGRNLSYFAEVLHSGFGVPASTPLDSLPADLSKRMSTGQLFFAGADFLTLGAQLEVTPDLSLAPNAIFSLNDGSAQATLSATWALGDSGSLVFSLSRPFGAPGTEFGGRETTAGSGIFATPATSATLKLVRFF